MSANCGKLGDKVMRRRKKCGASVRSNRCLEDARSVHGGELRAWTASAS